MPKRLKKINFNFSDSSEEEESISVCKEKTIGNRTELPRNVIAHTKKVLRPIQNCISPNDVSECHLPDTSDQYSTGKEIEKSCGQNVSQAQEQSFETSFISSNGDLYKKTEQIDTDIEPLCYHTQMKSCNGQPDFSGSFFEVCDVSAQTSLLYTDLEMTPECLKSSSELKDNSKDYFPLNQESSEVKSGSAIALANDSSEDEQPISVCKEKTLGNRTELPKNVIAHTKKVLSPIHNCISPNDVSECHSPDTSDQYSTGKEIEKSCGQNVSQAQEQSFETSFISSDEDLNKNTDTDDEALCYHNQMKSCNGQPDFSGSFFEVCDVSAQTSLLYTDLEMTPECLKPSSELKDNSKNYFPLNEESSEVENGSVIVLASASEDEEDLTSNTDLCQFGVNEHFTVPESDNEREDDESNIENKELKINTPHRLPVMDKLSPAVDLISVDGDSDDEDNEPHLTTSRLQGSSSPLFSSSHGVKEKVKLSKESLDQMVKLTGALSLNRKNKYDDSSSEDEFENFLGKIKKEVHMKSPSRSEMIPLDEFIVDDDSVSHTDEEEDELFYIKYNNDRLQENKREKREAYPGFDSESSISLSDDDSNSDSDHIETEHHTYRRNLGKKSEKISADLFYDRSNIEAKEDFSIDLLKENSLKSTKSLRSKSEELLEDRHNTCKTSTETFKTPLLNRVLQVHAATNPPPRKPGNIGFDDALHLLNSLSRDYPEYKQHPEAARFVRNFQRTKEELTKRLLFIFNEEVFENKAMINEDGCYSQTLQANIKINTKSSSQTLKLPKDLEIEWSQRYTKTAGTFCYRGTPSNFKAKITLSVKVCDSPERVRNTLAHELCHAAVKLINGANESHGPIWKSWARKINRKFPFMPTIARCHDYQINTKYTYQCVKCKYRIGRHSKSLDTERKVCGFCLGKFEVYLTKSLNSIKGDNPTTPAPKTPNKFALYVKECYSEKRKGTNLKHGDVMKLLSKEFAEKNKICDQSCQ